MSGNRSRITYQFKKAGSQVETPVSDNSLYVDIGNALETGVIDHHQDRKEPGAISLAFSSTVKAFDPEYVKHLIGKDNIVVYTHSIPDSDAILSTYMAKTVIEEGDEKYDLIFGEDKPGRKLIEYVDTIDQGKGKRIKFSSDGKTVSFYVAMCCLYRIAVAILYFRDFPEYDESSLKEFTEGLKKKSETECDHIMLSIGHSIVQRALECLLSDQKADMETLLLKWEDILAGADKKVTDYITDVLKNDHDKYEQEKRTVINFDSIKIWKKDGTGVEEKIKTAIWRDKPESEFCYLYARNDDDAVVTVIPTGIKEKDNGQLPSTKVRISIDPDAKKAEELSLKPLAEALELLEQIEENAFYRENGVWRRDHSRCRRGFEETPFSATSDPWFYMPDELLVENPKGGSFIEYSKIISMLENQTDLIRVIRSKNYNDGKLQNCKIDEEMMSISKWIANVKSIIKSNETENDKDQYRIIVTEVDPVMIRSRNDVLKALCMSALGKSLFESGDFFEPDYYSCIYANENLMVVVYARDPERKENAKNSCRLFSLIEEDGTDPVDRITDSISEIAEVVLNQRKDLLDYGRRLKTCVGNPGKSRELYRDFVGFLADEQEDSFEKNLVKMEIYDYLRRVLKIAETKESLIASVDIVTNDSKERAYSIFNFLTVVTVPFVLVSTLFQMGLIHFNALWNEKGFDWSNLCNWVFIMILTIGACIFFYNKGKK